MFAITFVRVCLYNRRLGVIMKIKLFEPFIIKAFMIVIKSFFVLRNSNTYLQYKLINYLNMICCFLNVEIF